MKAIDWMSNRLECPNISQHRGFKMIEQIGNNLFECECGEIFYLDEDGKVVSSSGENKNE